MCDVCLERFEVTPTFQSGLRLPWFGKRGPQL